MPTIGSPDLANRANRAAPQTACFIKQWMNIGMKVIDKWWRHLVKTGTWRIIGICVLSILSYLLTDSLVVATSIAAFDLIVKSALYFVHEWAWSKINMGREVQKTKGVVIWLTGLSGSGKTTVADAVCEALEKRLVPCARLDGDVARATFSADLGFSAADRAENCKRATHVAAYLKEHNIVIASFISPCRHMREYVRKLCGDDTIIIHIDCPVEICAQRDPKGMYAKLVDGKFKDEPFTGCHPDAPYEWPRTANDCGPPDVDFRIRSDMTSVEEATRIILGELKRKGFIS